MKTSKLDLPNLIRGFILSYQTEGKSPRTVEWYSSFLARFLNFLNAEGFPTLPNQLNRGHIRSFIKHLQTEVKIPHNGKQLSSFTIQGYVRTLKAFFSWSLREDYVKLNIMASNL